MQPGAASLVVHGGGGAGQVVDLVNLQTGHKKHQGATSWHGWTEGHGTSKAQVVDLVNLRQGRG